MNRLKFITTFFTGLILSAQTRINTNNLRTSDPATINPTELQLWGTSGDSFFTRIHLGPGLSARRVNNRIEIFSTNPNISLTTIPLTRQTARLYNSTSALINAQIFYNGLFMTPGVDYTPITGNSVNFLYDIDPSAVVTATVTGV